MITYEHPPSMYPHLKVPLPKVHMGPTGSNMAEGSGPEPGHLDPFPTTSMTPSGVSDSFTSSGAVTHGSM